MVKIALGVPVILFLLVVDIYVTFVVKDTPPKQYVVIEEGGVVWMKNKNK
jgi:hypothetical protein